jgi:uncharacterized protein YhbP (UPF0306 family)
MIKLSGAFQIIISITGVSVKALINFVINSEETQARAFYSLSIPLTYISYQTVWHRYLIKEGVRSFGGLSDSPAQI